MQETYRREPVASTHEGDRPQQTAAIKLTGGGVSSLFVDLRRGPKRSGQMLSALTPWMPGN
jgi:hypothetical protein